MITDACPFCLIIDGAPGSTPVEYSYPTAVVFTPLEPVTPGHLLVVPRTHVPDFVADPLQTAYAMEVATHVAHMIGGDMNLITSMGTAATQTVRHLHIHLVPRRAGDGLALPWSPKGLPESTQDDFDQALRVGRFAADDAAIGFQGTPAQRTGALVKRALGALLAQGMIALTPRSTWPQWNDIDRHHPFEGKASS